MGIRFYCEHCQQQLNVKAHQAGEEGVCPICQQPILVPDKSTALSKAAAATKKRKKAEQRARQKAIEDDQKTTANFSGTHEFQGLNPRQSSQVKTITEATAAPARLAASAELTGKPDDPPNKGNFLLDKPVNPWLAPNAPDPVETGLKKVWYVRHPGAV